MWRPYLPLPEQCELLVVRFPFPGTEVVAVLSRISDNLPPSDMIPAYICAGLIRSYYDLKKRMEKSESDSWSVLDATGHWERKGPYLIPKFTGKEYEKLFGIYLGSNIIISPDCDKPSICAVDLTEGDLRPLYRSDMEV
ncbi:MAG: hypothetical protein GY786_09785 [Proteobacteria bacterium]|nr:hypothetical protein [Pseudomonadota bacterium]